MEQFCQSVFGLLVLLAPGCLLAFESMPEFQSLTEADFPLFEGPNRLTPEYQSDILSYLKPDSYEYEWLTHRLAVDGTAGSTGAKHFMIDHRAKIRADFTQDLEFRFTYTDEGNQEREGTHHIFELIGWPTSFLGLSVYGEATLYKREDDTGLAIIARPQANHEIRVFNTFVDVARLKRNDRPDTFDSNHLPYARGLVGRWWRPPSTDSELPGRRDFLEYSFRYEPKAIWVFPVEKLDYTYWKIFASLWARRQMSEHWSLGIRAQWDRKFEGKIPRPGGTIAAEGWTTDRTFVRTEAVVRDPLDFASELESGILFAKRNWKTGDGHAQYLDWLPYATLMIPMFQRGQDHDRLGVGYDLTWHRSEGAIAMFYGAEERQNTLQNRLNITYDFKFKKNLALRALISGDIDELGTRHSWEGGNVLLRANF